MFSSYSPTLFDIYHGNLVDIFSFMNQSLKSQFESDTKIKNKATDTREPVAYECLNSRRFYLTGSITNFYSFIRGSLKWPFCELFVSDVSLWNQYKFIAFNIFSCIIFIIYCLILIITVISNEKTNELTI